MVAGSTVSWGRMGSIGAGAMVEVMGGGGSVPVVLVGAMVVVVGGGGSVPLVLVGAMVVVVGAVCDVQATATNKIAMPTAAARCRIGEVWS